MLYTYTYLHRNVYRYYVAHQKPAPLEGAGQHLSVVTIPESHVWLWNHLLLWDMLHVSHVALVNFEEVFTTQLAVQVPYQEVKSSSSWYLCHGSWLYYTLWSGGCPTSCLRHRDWAPTPDQGDQGTHRCSSRSTGAFDPLGVYRHLSGSHSDAGMPTMATWSYPSVSWRPSPGIPLPRWTHLLDAQDGTLPQAPATSGLWPYLPQPGYLLVDSWLWLGHYRTIVLAWDRSLPHDLRPWTFVLRWCGPQWTPGLQIHHQRRGPLLPLPPTMGAWIRIQDTPLESGPSSTIDLLWSNQCRECLARQTTKPEIKEIYYTDSPLYDTAADSENNLTSPTSRTTSQSGPTSRTVEFRCHVDTTCQGTSCAATQTSSATDHAFRGAAQTTAHHVRPGIPWPNGPGTRGYQTGYPDTRSPRVHSNTDWHARSSTHDRGGEHHHWPAHPGVTYSQHPCAATRTTTSSSTFWRQERRVHTPARPDVFAFIPPCGIWQPTPTTSRCSLPSSGTNHGGDDALAPTNHYPRGCPDAYDTSWPPCGWTHAPNGARILPPVSPASGASLGITSTIRYQFCPSSTPTLVLPPNDCPTMATDYLNWHTSTSTPHPRDAFGLAGASSTTDESCLPRWPWLDLLDQQSGWDHGRGHRWYRWRRFAQPCSRPLDLRNRLTELHPRWRSSGPIHPFWTLGSVRYPWLPDPLPTQDTWQILPARPWCSFHYQLPSCQWSPEWSLDGDWRGGDLDRAHMSAPTRAAFCSFVCFSLWYLTQHVVVHLTWIHTIAPLFDVDITIFTTCEFTHQSVDHPAALRGVAQYSTPTSGLTFWSLLDSRTTHTTFLDWHHETENRLAGPTSIRFWPLGRLILHSLVSRPLFEKNLDFNTSLHHGLLWVQRMTILSQICHIGVLSMCCIDPCWEASQHQHEWPWVSYHLLRSCSSEPGRPQPLVTFSSFDHGQETRYRELGLPRPCSPKSSSNGSGWLCRWPYRGLCHREPSGSHSVPATCNTTGLDPGISRLVHREPQETQDGYRCLYFGWRILESRTRETTQETTQAADPLPMPTWDFVHQLQPEDAMPMV